MTQFEFDLADRIQKIKSVNEQFDLEHNGFISFSGGKDSVVLSKVVDLALPGNEIPRVFFNTGIEYKAILKFVRELAQKDERYILYSSGVKIKEMLEEKGYPFKSKEFSQKMSIYQKSGKTKTVTDYLGETGNKAKTFQCPEKLKPMFNEELSFKVSDKCCVELKKKVSERFSEEYNKPVVMTGMRKAEGGNRKSVQGCTVFDKGKLHKFHPLFPVTSDFIEKAIYISITVV